LRNQMARVSVAPVACHDLHSARMRTPTSRTGVP
jgi:hypothetical protein